MSNLYNSRHSGEPAFMHDPELYAQKFGGARGNYQSEECQAGDSEDCTPDEAEYYCDVCGARCCEACSVETGIGNDHRCLTCENKNLAKLQEACRLIGTDAVQKRIADALMGEMMVMSTLLEVEGE